MCSPRTAIKMGNCFKSCLPENSAAKALRNLNILDDPNSGVDFTCLVDDAASITENNKSRSMLSRLFKKTTNKKPVLQMVDGLLSPQAPSYSRLSESQQPSLAESCTSKDIQLQCLDARALLQRTATSTPASSLDLEWEHETLHTSMIHDPSGSSWTALPEDVSLCPSISSHRPSTNQSAVSESDWSRVSSENSLEWDNVQNPIPPASSPLSEVDADTQFLLCEIERLTNKTLEETGRDLFS